MNLRRIIGRLFQHNCKECGMCMNKSVKMKFKDKNGFNDINSTDKEE